MSAAAPAPCGRPAASSRSGSAEGGSALGWPGIARLGVVQASLGAVVVMTTTTLNRVMVVELALPAILPGALVAGHYAVQALRPRWGHGSDGSRRRTPWILGGMAALAVGGTAAAAGVALMGTDLAAGLALATVAYLLVGAGVGAAGTSLLALAATGVAPQRRAAAAAVIWIMMIAGFAATAGIAGSSLDPFSMPRLVAVVASVSAVAFGLSAACLVGLEGGAGRAVASTPSAPRVAFGPALRQVWAEPAARRFTLFVFVSMLAYGSQDLVLDPFAGRILGLTPGETTRLTGLQHGGALLGMLAVAVAGALRGRRHPSFLKLCAAAGCVTSAAVLAALAAAGAVGAFPLRPAVALLGFANGTFAVAAVGTMMTLAGRGAEAREGLRMGLWGAAQAVAFGVGAVAGPGLVELGSALFGASAPAYAAVFLAQALLFLLSARLVSAAPSGVPAVERGAALIGVSS